MQSRVFATASVVLGAFGCSPAAEQSAVESCELGTLTGSYLVTYTERAGDCGPQASASVRLERDAVPDGCMEAADPKLDSAACTLETSTVCPFPLPGCAPLDGRSGARIESTTLLRQLDEEGDTLGGTLTLELWCSDAAAPECTGTYGVRYVRQ